MNDILKKFFGYIRIHYSQMQILLWIRTLTKKPVDTRQVRHLRL